MRTIKFRGKTKSGKWIYSDGILQADIPDKGGAIETVQLWEEGEGWVYVEPATVGQFTGLHSISGKEIYEGDIISFDDVCETESGYYEKCGCIGTVFWDKETVAFCVTGRGSCESYEALADCEVIGNIYDNPELLEVE